MSVATRVHVPATGLRAALRQFALAALLCSAVAAPAVVPALGEVAVRITAGGEDNTWPVQPAPVTLAASLGGEDNTWPVQPVTSASVYGTDDNTWPVQPAA
ncbi:hypothetical protein [Streptomyces sp. NPDC053542]|uniref:hypothetical protein n=1 Tax=Streptomyces sp. NPDC053542 TaxID=3365710 RepID=UPI0037D8E5DB